MIKNVIRKGGLIFESWSSTPLLDARSWVGLSENLWLRYGVLFTGAYLLTLAVYSYFFTTIIFTNHTLPNIWLNEYPSFKTRLEGRWFADIIIQLTGGSGVQAFQMALAAGIQIINAFLFAELLNVNGKFKIFLFASFLALHPAFLDYYSFATDHVSFAFGDTLALLGILALDRIADRRLGVGLAILCFVLTLATYPPKVALVATLLLIWCLRSSNSILDRSAVDPGFQPRPHFFTSRILTAALVFAAALALYYLSTKATVTASPQARNHLNTPSQIFYQLIFSYPETFKNFTTRVDYLPKLLVFIPALAILLGSAAIIRDNQRAQKGVVFLPIILSIALILCFPIALRFSYIVNDQTWPNAGRILSAHAYFLLFFLASAWLLPAFHRAATVLLVILVYFFGVIGTQETNAAAIKSIFEIEKINRVVARIEQQVPDLYQRKLPLIVIGELKFQSQGRLRKFSPVLYSAQVTTDTFVRYRQIEILNYFLGQSQIVGPSKTQIDAVIDGQRDRRPWPAPESVYLQDDVIVVLLESYRPNVAITLAH